MIHYIILSTVCFSSQGGLCIKQIPNNIWETAIQEPYCILSARISESSATVKDETAYQIIPNSASVKQNEEYDPNKIEWGKGDEYLDQQDREAESHGYRWNIEQHKYLPKNHLANMTHGAKLDQPEYLDVLELIQVQADWNKKQEERIQKLEDNQVFELHLKNPRWP